MKRRDIIIGYLAGIVLIVILIWAYKSNKKDTELLKNEGQIVVGVITEVVDRKRGLDFKYQFVIKDRVYESWQKTYKPFNLGDTIEIVYYPSNPAISKPALEMK